MCGIAGFVDLARQPDPDGVLGRMTGAIQHRGPDDFGYHSDESVRLGHRRLSIIDLATGHQPMANEDSTLWIVYNGEIFNHAALRAGLEQAGHRYQTHSDTETILHAYEQHGAGCVDHFRGMFAFALWDRPNRRLFCARDRLGIKPFYYYWDGRLFAFASEIKALLQHPQIAARLEESSLPEYLAFGYTGDEHTLFSRILRLPPGSTLTLEIGADGLQPPRIRRYWDVPPPAPQSPRPEREWIAECRHRLEETVRMRLMSDVPLGVFLSGGVDSSAIAALMKRFAPGPVETFSVGYRETPFSELDYARHVARTLGTEHHEVLVGRDEFFAELPRLIWHEDEPITWPSSVPLYFLSRLASQRVKVVLTGEGSDELFAGYERYGFYLRWQPWAARYGRLPAGLRRRIEAFLATSRLLSADLRRKLGHTFLGRGAALESLYLDNFCAAFNASERPAYEGGAAAGSPYASFLRHWEQRAGTPLARLLYADQKTYLAELLMKQDQMSMAASLESRVPFLDHPFVEFAAQVPDELKLRGRMQKYILKRAVEDLLPRDIVYRRKMGSPPRCGSG
jgi:asparagine synthase (glutamine-hydrolysing)